MNEGDYFKWRYKQHVIDARADSVAVGTLYWCCANIAIFKNGMLRDIYWSTVSDNRTWSKEDASKDLILTFLVNEKDIVHTDFPQLYNPEDVIDLRHPNNYANAIYIKSGAKRSREQIEKLIHVKMGEEKNKIESAKRQLKFLNNKLIELETADLEKFYV